MPRAMQLRSLNTISRTDYSLEYYDVGKGLIHCSLRCEALSHNCGCYCYQHFARSHEKLSTKSYSSPKSLYHSQRSAY